MVAERPQGILAIFNNIAAGREPDFERWFQHEHLAERLSVPGFLLGRRYEATSGPLRFFNYYLTESADVLTSPAYLSHLDNPTPMTRMIMSEIFRDMNRTVCEQTLRVGVIRGAAAVVARFPEKPTRTSLQPVVDDAMQDPSVASAEIWTAAAGTVPVSQEERLRGGDRKIGGCLLVETLRLADAERIAASLMLPRATISTYRLLCDIRR